MAVLSIEDARVETMNILGIVHPTNYETTYKPDQRANNFSSVRRHPIIKFDLRPSLQQTFSMRSSSRRLYSSTFLLEPLRDVMERVLDSCRLDKDVVRAEHGANKVPATRPMKSQFIAQKG